VVTLFDDAHESDVAGYESGNQHGAHFDLSRLEPLNSSSKVRFQVPGTPVGCGLLGVVVVVGVVVLVVGVVVLVLVGWVTVVVGPVTVTVEVGIV
jgi:hypothetical protein